MKLRSILFLILMTTFSAKSFSQASPDGINWLTISEAEKLAKDEPRKIIVDIYTDWCGWCKRMDASTYKDKQIVEYINKNFYAVKFNAESKTEITFQGKTYTYDPLRRTNGLCALLMSNSSGYPTTTFLSDKLEVLSVVPGYQNTEMMRNIVHYFGENAYLKMDWNKYLSSLSEASPKD